jgi:hypothetical protein
MEHKDHLSAAIRMAKLERFRIKKVEELKAGVYFRFFASYHNSGVMITELISKPMKYKTHKKKIMGIVSDGTVKLSEMEAIIDRWLVMNARPLETNTGIEVEHDRDEKCCFVSDQFVTSNCYRANSKVENFAKEWKWMSVADANIVWQMYLKIVNRENEDLEYLDSGL